MKSTNIIIAIIVLVLIGGGVYVLSDNNDEAMMEKDVMTNDNAMVKNEMKDETMMSWSSDVMMVKGASYEAYSPEKIAYAENGNVVLFFRAGWCPTCRAVDADIKSHMDKIPANLTILDVNYDNSSDLKKKYGVTVQHTFVQVDSKGNLIKKWIGSPTLQALISEVK